MNHQAAVKQVLAQYPYDKRERKRLFSIYHAAADRLEGFGWCQRKGETHEGRRCMSQAVSKASSSYDDNSRPSFFVMGYGPSVHMFEAQVVGQTSSLAQEVLVHMFEAQVVGQTSSLAQEVLVAWLGEPIIPWNDSPERTAEEVVKTLRALADYLATPPEVYRKS